MDEETGGAEMGFDDPCVVHKLFTSDSSIGVGTGGARGG